MCLVAPRLHLQCVIFFHQTSTLALPIASSARTTAASPCAGSVTEITTAATMRMSPTPPAQVQEY